MKTNGPLIPARRRHLTVMLSLAVSACASTRPDAPVEIPEPRQTPTRVGLLPIPKYGEVGLYYSKGSKTLVSIFTGGLGALAMYGSEKSISKEFTARLAQQELSPASYLRNGVVAALREIRSDVHAIDDTVRTAPAMKAWKFAGLAQEADAVLHLDLNEVAYSAISIDRYWPRMSAGMTLISTQNNEELGAATYQVRIDPDTSDPRSITPLARNVFESGDQLLSQPARAAQALRDDFDRIIRLIANDVATLQRGEELKWEAA